MTTTQETLTTEEARALIDALKNALDSMYCNWMPDHEFTATDRAISLTHLAIFGKPYIDNRFYQGGISVMMGRHPDVLDLYPTPIDEAALISALKKENGELVK